MSVKKLSILGSTGSIGTQALSLVDDLGITVTALSASRNSKLMEEQVRRFQPSAVCMADEEAAKDLAVRISDLDTRVLSGESGMVELASSDECDTVLNSVVGIAGLLPTLAAIDAGKDIALANKETLVTGGQIVTSRIRDRGVSSCRWTASIRRSFSAFRTDIPPQGSRGYF